MFRDRGAINLILFMFLSSEPPTSMIYNRYPTCACWKNKQMYSYICFPFSARICDSSPAILYSFPRKYIQLLRKGTKKVLDISA